MTGFVLDNSVTMRWLLATEKATDQGYAESALKSMTHAPAFVPNLWHLEVANVLVGGLSRKDLEISDVERFTTQLENLPIQVDPFTAGRVFGHTLTIAREYKLSSYDAAYLELSLRMGLPLASLDKNLLRAARKAGISLYLN